MSISTIITLGYGSFGSVPDVLRLGYGGQAAASTDLGMWPIRRTRSRKKRERDEMDVYAAVMLTVQLMEEERSD